MPDSPNPGKRSGGKPKRLRKARSLDEDSPAPPPPPPKQPAPRAQQPPPVGTGKKPPPRPAGGKPPAVRAVKPSAAAPQGPLPQANPLGIQTEPTATGTGGASAIAYRRKKSPLPLILVLLVVLGGGAGVGIYFGMQPGPVPDPVASADGAADGSQGSVPPVSPPAGSDGMADGGAADGSATDGSDGSSNPHPGGADGGSPPFNPTPGGNAGSHPAEGTYLGKTVKQWTDQLLRGHPLLLDKNAAAAFAQGLSEPPDRDVLLAALQDADARLRIKAFAALQNYYGEVPAAELLAALESKDHDLQQAAIYLAGLQRDNPREVIAALLELAAGSDDPQDIARALSTADASGVEQIVAALDSPDGRVQDTAIRAIAHVGLDPAEVLRHLERFCSSPDAALRVSAMTQLGQMGPAARPAVETLEGRLAEDQDPAARRQAAVALCRIDPGRRFSARVLTQEGEEVPGKKDLVHALLFTPESVPDLTSILDVNPSDREAIQALGMMGPLAKDAAPALLKIVRDDKMGGRLLGYEAARALAALGPGAADVVPQLLELARQRGDEFAIVRANAAVTLGKLRAPDAIPLLTEMLAGQDRMIAVEALGWMGEAAAETSPALRELARTGGLTNDEFYQLQLALGRIEPQGDDITRQRYTSVLEIPEVAVPADLTVALQDCIKLLEAEDYDKLQADHFHLGQGGEAASAGTRARIKQAAGPLLRALRYAEGQKVRLIDGGQTALYALSLLGDEGSPGLTFTRDGDRWRLTFPLPGAGLPQSVQPTPPPYHQALYQLEVMNRIRAVPGTSIERSAEEAEAIENLVAMGAYVAATGGDGGPQRTAVHFAARYYYGGDVGFELLGQLTNVEVLIVDQADYLSEFALQRIAELQSLRFLKMPYPGYLEPELVHVMPTSEPHERYLGNHRKAPLEFVAGLRDLQVLCLDNWQPPPPRSNMRGGALPGNPEIEIFKATTHRPAGLQHLAGLSQLERLVISGDYVPPVCICDAELQQLAPLKKLREVSLNEVARISPQGVEQLREKLPGPWVQWPHHTFP